MCHAKGPQRSDTGEARTRGLSVSSQALYHCAPSFCVVFICLYVTEIKEVCNVKLTEPQHVISNNVVCATSKGSDQPAHTRSLIRAFASGLNII